MKKKIIIAVAAVVLLIVTVVWFIMPVSMGRKLYNAYLYEKFREHPTIVSEEYHYHFSPSNLGHMGVDWEVDAGIYGSYQFRTIGRAVLFVDGEQYFLEDKSIGRDLID